MREEPVRRRGGRQDENDADGGENGPPSEPRTATPRAGGEPEDVPVPALPLAGAGVLAALLASAAYRLRNTGRRASSGGTPSPRI